MIKRLRALMVRNRSRALSAKRRRGPATARMRKRAKIRFLHHPVSLGGVFLANNFRGTFHRAKTRVRRNSVGRAGCLELKSQPIINNKPRHRA